MKHDSVDRFAWEDTGENIAIYRERITPTDEELEPGRLGGKIGMLSAIVALPAGYIAAGPILRALGNHAQDLMIEKCIGELIGAALAFVMVCLFSPLFVKTHSPDYRQFK